MKVRVGRLVTLPEMSRKMGVGVGGVGDPRGRAGIRSGWGWGKAPGLCWLESTSVQGTGSFGKGGTHRHICWLLGDVQIGGDGPACVWGAVVVETAKACSLF